MSKKIEKSKSNENWTSEYRKLATKMNPKTGELTSYNENIKVRYYNDHSVVEVNPQNGDIIAIGVGFNLNNSQVSNKNIPKTIEKTRLNQCYAIIRHYQGKYTLKYFCQLDLSLDKNDRPSELKQNSHILGINTLERWVNAAHIIILGWGSKPEWANYSYKDRIKLVHILKNNSDKLFWFGHSANNMNPFMPSYIGRGAFSRIIQQNNINDFEKLIRTIIS